MNFLKDLGLVASPFETKGLVLLTLLISTWAV
jgi:hypothetical protein